MYLQGRFPNPKPLQTEFRQNAGTLAVNGSAASSSDVGTATDLMIRFLLAPDDVPASALAMFPFNPDFNTEVRNLAAIASRAVREGESGQEPFARAIWGLALCVGAYRAGAAYAPFVPDLVHSGSFDAEVMMLQASSEAVAELIALRHLAEQRLLPRLKAPFHLGPEFDLSQAGPTQRIAAEADLIAGGLLLDIKTQLGLKDKSGKRYDVLRPEQLYQLIAYALLDYSDKYAITHVGIYSARYGTLTAWSLPDLLWRAAGAPVDLQMVRNELWAVMQDELAFRER